jgi:predicted DNA-binding WGR domain protein
MSALELYRIDLERNMRRFYRLGIDPDLFGGVLLMKEWGRIGARARHSRAFRERGPCGRGPPSPS